MCTSLFLSLSVLDAVHADVFTPITEKNLSAVGYFLL